MRLLILILFIFCFRAQAETAPECSRSAESRPFNALPAGQVDTTNPVEHIVVLMQENHSFDNYFGRLNQPQFYGSEIDGVTDDMFNTNLLGQPDHAYHETDPCGTDPMHSWNAEHFDWNHGKNDNFAKSSGHRVMGYYDQRELPFYYALANNFAVADRYFSSALTSTYPNRFFLYTATAFGHIKNDSPGKDATQFAQQTIFDMLDRYNVSWKYYTDDLGYLSLFRPMWNRDRKKATSIANYYEDLIAGKLPQVVFIDASFDGEDEHPDADVQKGQAWVSGIINSLMLSSSWKSSALFLTYDENGGLFDHVAPPQACAPDQIAPRLSPLSLPGGYDRYGFRVPFVLISPFAKHHFVSHKTYDHTAILKYIETKYNLPALTARDANADGMSDLFDYHHPNFTVPSLPEVTAHGPLSCDRN